MIGPILFHQDALVYASIALLPDGPGSCTALMPVWHCVPSAILMTPPMPSAIASHSDPVRRHFLLAA